MFMIYKWEYQDVVYPRTLIATVWRVWFPAVYANQGPM